GAAPAASRRVRPRSGLMVRDGASRLLTMRVWLKLEMAITGKRRDDMAILSDVLAAEPPRFPAFRLRGLAGTSFKHEHLAAILADGKQRGFFEVHAENYMGAGGPPHRALEAVRRDHPV